MPTIWLPHVCRSRCFVGLRSSSYRPGFAMRSAPAAAAHGKTGALCHGFAMSARRSLPPFLFRDGVHCDPLEEYFEEFVTVLLCGECVLNPSVLEGAIFHSRPIMRPQIRCLWNKSFPSSGNMFSQSSCTLQFSSTDTVNFISRGSDIPQSAWKTQKVVWCIHLKTVKRLRAGSEYTLIMYPVHNRNVC